MGRRTTVRGFLHATSTKPHDTQEKMCRNMTRADMRCYTGGMDTPTTYLTVAETADLCRVTPRTVRRWIADGTLNVQRAGRRVLITQADIDQMLGTTPAPDAD